MDLTSAVLLKATTPLVKKIVEDIYDFGKAKVNSKYNEWNISGKERSIARAISKITHVKTLWNIDKEVSLYDFYYPSQISFGSSVTKKIDCLKDFGVFQNFVIQGTAGQGKSIFLRYLCGQELRAEFTSNRLPIFVELRRIKPGFGVRSLILESLQKYGIGGGEAALDDYAESGKFVFLFDAFDEIDPSLTQEALGEIEFISEKYSEKLQIIISSRPNADIQYSSRFRVCRLNQLKPSDHLPFLRKICSDKTQADDLNKVVSNSPTDVKGLLTSPLMLTLLVMLYKSIQTVPDTVPRFYEELFDVLFYRHDHSKPGFRRKRFTSLDDTTIRNLFSAFCFYVRLKGYGTVSMRQLEECCELACKAIGVKVESKKFKDEIVKTVCLMQEEGFELSFIHKSVAEYYAASFVRDSSDKFASKFYELMLEHFKADEWGLELKFLSQIDRYRHAKYFEIPCLSDFENKLSISIGEVVSEDDQIIIEREFCNDTFVRFSKTTEGKFQPCGWRRPILGNFFFDEAKDRWLDRLSRSDITLSISEGLFETSKGEPEKDGRFSLKCEICLIELPKKRVLEAMDDVAKFLLTIRKNALEVIDREEHKASQIDDLLGLN